MTKKSLVHRYHFAMMQVFKQTINSFNQPNNSRRCLHNSNNCHPPRPFHLRNHRCRGSPARRFPRTNHIRRRHDRPIQGCRTTTAWGNRKGWTKHWDYPTVWTNRLGWKKYLARLMDVSRWSHRRRHSMPRWPLLPHWHVHQQIDICEERSRKRCNQSRCYHKMNCRCNPNGHSVCRCMEE